MQKHHYITILLIKLLYTRFVYLVKTFPIISFLSFVCLFLCFFVKLGYIFYNPLSIILFVPTFFPPKFYLIPNYNIYIS